MPFVAKTALAQEVVLDNDRWCDEQHDHWNDSDQVHYCEVREIKLDDRGTLKIDARPNGGISLEAWDKDEILVRAKVTTAARSKEDAIELARRVSISTGSTVEADGPRTDDQEWYSVSFEVFAPAKTDLDLESQNGGIAISNMTGRTRFETQNGGVSLVAMSGDVSGETTNGGVSVDLTGDSWNGAGLDVETTNGGVSIAVPNGYSAELETGTVNGRMKVDFPVMVEGTFDNKLSATLGEGGKTIKVTTTNGSVRIKRG